MHASLAAVALTPLLALIYVLAVRGTSPGRLRMNTGGIGLGGILVIAGIIIAIFWSVLIGVIVALIGLIAFGGFVRGRWY